MTGKQTHRYHGINGYKKRGCRCEVCQAAYDSYNKNRRKHPELAPKIDPEPLIEFIIGSGEKITGGLGQQFARWRRSGGVDLFIADAACVRRGYHPFEIYGDAWYDIPFVEA